MLIKKIRIPVAHIVMIGFLPSFLKKFVYRLKGYKIARNVNLGLGCVIIGKEVEIRKNSSIGFLTIVRADKIKIGRFVKIGSLSVIDTARFEIDDDARINEQVYVGGIKTPESALLMGKRTIIMQASYLNPTLPIIIGDDSGIGGDCLLFTHGSWNSELEGYPVKFAPITIGKKVWLPWRVFIMPGVTIGDNVVIGADSMINKDIPANCLVAGSPAKILKENFPTPLSEEEKSKITERIFSEFSSHLMHNGFNVDMNFANGALKMSVKQESTNAFINYCEDESLKANTETYNSILIVRKGTAKNISAYGMMISLEDNTRIGSSFAGEELISFLSRYGIRFNRLD
ncbi:MAG TPA: hypothetical protein VNZ49_06450 [Bacteroidia bacterium]|nr:hypothetical protein [Bacteroidia bacterium]